MTVQPERRSANHWPGLDVVPAGPRATVSAAVARRLFTRRRSTGSTSPSHVGDRDARAAAARR